MALQWPKRRSLKSFPVDAEVLLEVGVSGPPPLRVEMPAVDDYPVDAKIIFKVGFYVSAHRFTQRAAITCS